MDKRTAEAIDLLRRANTETLRLLDSMTRLLDDQLKVLDGLQEIAEREHGVVPVRIEDWRAS